MRLGAQGPGAWCCAVTLMMGAQAACAGTLALCDRPAATTARQQDRLLALTALIRGQLQASGGSVAIVSRAGTDLHRFGVRQTHASIALAAHPQGAWAVRQLYYACSEGRPRLFDQGLTSFVAGTETPDQGAVSVVVLPPEAAVALADWVLDDARAQQVLGRRYSANAYAWGLQYQNCNQWLAEGLAMAWGAGSGAVPAAGADMPSGELRSDTLGGVGGDTPTGVVPDPVTGARAAAQAWLQAAGYEPAEVDVGWRLLQWAAWFVPYVHDSDHPAALLAQQRYRTHLPASIEAFVHQRWPQAQRFEVCQRGGRAVLHAGWVPAGPGCEVGEGDQVTALDAGG